MGFLDALFGSSSTPSARQIDGAITALTRRHGEPALRYEAADRLLGWGTPEAVDGLLKRFAMTAEREMSDEEEKAYIVDRVAEKIGARAIPQLETYLRREEQVNWPLRLLRRVTEPEDFRDRVVKILSGLDVHFDKHPIRKVEIIHALMDFAAEPAVSSAVGAFLDDTDDTVRIAAGELLARSARPEDHAAIVGGLVASPDRPRVRAGLARLLVGVTGAGAARREELAAVMPDGFALDAAGTFQNAAPATKARR